MLACCGIDCASCEARSATEKDDDDLRARVAESWSALYEADIKHDQVHCTGCRAEGVKFFYCESLCPVRRCCEEKGLDTCAACPEFACEKLAGIHQAMPQARKALEALRG